MGNPLIVVALEPEQLDVDVKEVEFRKHGFVPSKHMLGLAHGAAGVQADLPAGNMNPQIDQQDRSSK
ncbi:MAG: hypothetical protein C0483_17475 [Pirellula sp.]|nr:hypothetical protein [Pirellula sp.]